MPMKANRRTRCKPIRESPVQLAQGDVSKHFVNHHQNNDKDSGNGRVAEN